MTNKISIVGRGTAGCLAVLHFNKYWPGEIEWIYDPNTKPQSVGEGSQISFPKNLYDTIGFNLSDIDKLDGTLKVGIKKQNWGDTKEFFHNFQSPSVGIHFNAVKFQKFVYETLSLSKKVSLVEKKINNLNDIDSDKIYYLGGKPKDINEEYHTDLDIPVNSVHVNQCYWDYPQFNYTLTIARPYGWVFGIPLQNRCSIGYLYNNNINSLDEVKKDIKHVIKDLNLIASNDTNSFNFDNYYRKFNFTKNISYGGNASFFLEPLEATSIHTMDFINRCTYDYFLNGVDQTILNARYDQWNQETQTLIMMHYFAGSNFDTDFWKYAEAKGKHNMLSAINKPKFIKFVQSIKNSHNEIDEDYWGSGWGVHSFRENVTALGLYEKIKKLCI